jgi:hydroxymethylpyrimidine/phosphomethylpyrimidine kinase
MIPIALTIAGSDPSGGAGIQADLKTFHQFGVYGTSVLTLVTVQNTVEVSRVEVLAADLVAEQLEAVSSDMSLRAAKTGALGSVAIIEEVAARAAEFSFPLVIDPVMISKHGASLLSEPARSALVHELLPHAFLLTPNLQEAFAICGIESWDQRGVEYAARAIADLGPQAVLVKGGHLHGDAPEAPETEAKDTLFWKGELHHFTAPRIRTKNTHGTGCTLSAAITACLAQGMGLIAAVETAKRFITRAIETNPGIGKGYGPVNHMVSP